MTAKARPRAVCALSWLGFGTLAVLLLIPLWAAWKLAPDLGHGWAAPLLIGYLFWERWSERAGSLSQRGGMPGFPGWLFAVALGLLALPLRLLLIPYPVWPALLGLYAGLLVFTALVAAWIQAGWRGVRWLGGPLSILVAALPWPYQLQQHMILPLREIMAGLAAEICNVLGHPAIASGTTVQLGSAWVGIDEACGGIRSLQATVMLALFFGEWCRFSPWRRAALVAVAALAASSGNFLRILFLAFRLGSGLPAFTAAHDPAGWVALIFSVAVTGLVAWRWARHSGSIRRSTRVPPAPPLPHRQDARAAPWQASPLWLCVVVSLFALDEAGARAWFALGAVSRADVPRWTAHFPETLPSYQSIPLTDLGRQMLQPDHFVSGKWLDGAERTVSAYYIEWDSGQVARFVPFLHNPTVCLPYAGCDLLKDLGIVSIRRPGGDIPFHRYLFRQAGEDLAVAFAIWDTDRNRPLEKPGDGAGWTGWLRSRWADVTEARESQPAQLLSVAISGRKGVEALDGELEALIAPVSRG